MLDPSATKFTFATFSDNDSTKTVTRVESTSLASAADIAQGGQAKRTYKEVKSDLLAMIEHGSLGKSFSRLSKRRKSRPVDGPS